MIIALSYFIITTLYFGYDDIDSEKGIYKFYWSGLNGLWKKDKPFGFKKDEPVITYLDGIDGPYIYGDTIYVVDENSKLQQYKLNGSKNFTVNTLCKELPKFNVTLRETIVGEAQQHDMPSKLIAISDIEGNFAGFYSFLVANNVIDKDANWIFGNGHLVLNGDFIDRGNEVAQVLWLIYHLENQASKHGGKVHYILGNHEIMNMYGDVSYNDFKYIEVAKRISKQADWDKALRRLYTAESVLGKWLRCKNIIEKIGGNIFVHGGLNSYHLKNRYTISELNAIAKHYYGVYPTEKSVRNERDRNLISSINSPFWDRRLNFEWKYKIMFKLNGIDAKATTQNELDNILKFYDASRIIIGHSVVDDISTGYNNKVIKIDLKHGDEISSGKTKGLLVEKNAYYKIDDQRNKTKLFN
ncbi:metallophosphoesterase [Pedobacter frigiditerrae]|uniref:metallophosphoesterase n=1 Tax=Pedobacter frigiditerrae TaxID=2530452 RepID=UPI0029302D2A|nr:metallophosphoesterase [Pedobacter frigiditerrae]